MTKNLEVPICNLLLMIGDLLLLESTNLRNGQPKTCSSFYEGMNWPIAEKLSQVGLFPMAILMIMLVVNN